MSGHIISRQAWGAAPPIGAYTPRSIGYVRTCFVHYSDTHESIPALGEASDAEIVRAIQQDHFRRGYVDIAYEAIVGGAGDIFVGRPNWAYDASTCNHNHDGYGICVLSDGPITGAQAGSVRFCVALGRLAFPNMAHVPEPHSAACPTACPGDQIRAWIAATAW